MPMVEVRPRMLRGGVQVRAVGVGGRYAPPGVVGVAGTGIFRGMLQTSSSAAAHRVLSPEENKENIPPPPPPRLDGSGTPRSMSRSRSRRKPNKKSPLPVWYPRTPLRDITAIVNAMEKRRLRLRAAAIAARPNQSSSSPSQQEAGDSPSGQALGASSPSDGLGSPAPSCVASPPASFQKALGSSEEITKASDVFDSPPQDSATSDSTVKGSKTELATSGSATVRDQISASGKNLVDQLDVIRKLIRVEELRKEASGAVKPKPSKRNTLLSMR